MTEQAPLFDAPTAAVLTDRQTAVLALVNAHPDGVSADEAGAAAHAIPGPRSTYTHPADQRCTWCPKEGKRLLDQLIAAGLVRRRKSREPGTTGYRYVPATGAQEAEPMGTAGREGFDASGFPVNF